MVRFVMFGVAKVSSAPMEILRTGESCPDGGFHKMSRGFIPAQNWENDLKIDFDAITSVSDWSCEIIEI